MTRATCRRRTGEAPPRAEKFGDLITADHVNLETTISVQSLYKVWFGYSIDSVVPVQNKNSPGDGKEFKKNFRAVTQAESHLHSHFIEIWQSL